MVAGCLGGVFLEIFERLDDQRLALFGLPALRRSLVSASNECEDVTVRVTKGIGSRGYESVRVSATCRLPASRHLASCPAEAGRETRWGSAPRFQHCGRFEGKWQDFQLSSSILHLRPAEEEIPLEFNHTSGRLRVDVRLPPKGTGVHGIIIGDPCTSSRYLPGLCNGQFDVLNRLPQILNLLNSVDKLDFIAIIGDNFYDVHGALTADFWRRLSARTQQVFLLAVPGNHDFWMFSPEAPLVQDQLGMGFAQWYGQDTAGGGPAAGNWPQRSHELPGGDKFFFYHTLGNIGFLGYSGAHSWEEQKHLFAEACEHFARERPREVYLLGHWNKPGLGCQEGMDVPQLFKTLQNGVCSEVADRMRYFMGHDHCNSPVADDRGYLLGAGGAGHGGCREWGFAYVDTRGSAYSHLIAHFAVARGDDDRLPAMEECISGKRSLSACTSSLADVWLNDTGSALPA